MADDIVIYHSRLRLLFVLLGSLMFVFLGYWFALYGHMAIAAIGWLSVVFFGACGIFGAWRLIRRKPALIVCDKGIVDHASAVAAGFVPWSEVLDVKTIPFMSQEFLGVFVANPTAILARQSMMKRKVMQANLSMVGTPITIPRAGLGMNLKKVEAIVRSRWDAAKIR